MNKRLVVTAEMKQNFKFHAKFIKPVMADLISQARERGERGAEVVRSAENSAAMLIRMEAEMDYHDSIG